MNSIAKSSSRITVLVTAMLSCHWALGLLALFAYAVVGLAVPSTVGAGLLVSVVSYAWGCF